LAGAALTSEEQKLVTEFQENVIKPSMEKLVILEFWSASYGQPNPMTPILETTAAQYADRGVLLSKINVDENQFIASQFQIRTIPTIYALFQGQPVAELTQAQNAEQLTKMLDELLEKLPITPADGVPPEQLEAMLNTGEQSLNANDAPSAFEIFRQILSILPDNSDAISGMIRAMVAMGEIEKAQEILDQLPEDKKSEAAITRAQTAITMAAESKSPDELEGLKNAYAQTPDDHEKGYELANAMFAGGDRDGAVNILLSIIASDKDWNEGAARSRLLEIFGLVGLEDPWTAQNRRKLSAILFG